MVEPNVTEADHALARDPDLRKGLGLGAFKGWGVAENEAFASDYARLRASIQQKGAGATLKEMLGAIAAG